MQVTFLGSGSCRDVRVRGIDYLGVSWFRVEGLGLRGFIYKA